MPKPGTKSKPSKLKILQGNPGKRKISEKEPKPKILKKIPKPPSWLDYYAKKEWNRRVPQLMEIGLLTEIDMTTFMIYCQRFADWVRAEKSLMKNGQTFRNDKGNLTNRPEELIARKAATQLRMYAENLGLSAAARSGLEIETGNDEPSIEDILNSDVS